MLNYKIAIINFGLEDLFEIPKLKKSKPAINLNKLLVTEKKRGTDTTIFNRYWNGINKTTTHRN